MSTTIKLVEMRTRYLENKESYYDLVVGFCQSPIEQLFVATMMLDGYEGFGGFVPEPIVSRLDLGHGRSSRWQILESDWCYVVCQATIKGLPYRIDFAFFEKDGPTLLAVELDGHDFHERTKEQAARDKKRDRDISAAGWRTLRFTGSEVYQDPAKCLNEVWQIVYKLYQSRKKDGR